MKGFRTSLLTIIVSTAAAVVVYNYVPMSWFDTLPSFQKEKPFGATITTILGTDTISGSRTTINTNFTNLNTDKIEVATTSVGNITALPGLTTANSLTSASALVTVGTITTGRWNAGIVQGTYGGTGTSTLTAYAVMIASSTGNGLMQVSGLGTSGQFLTSQGAGTAPQWTTSAVDQALGYNWTGYHTFNIALLRIASSSDLTIASSTVGRLVATTTVNFTGATITGLSRASSTTWNASNTYRKSAGVSKLFVEAIGAGASGGKGSNNAGGGGGGEYRSRWINAADVGATETVTVGVGGAARSTDGTGNVGANSTFGSLLTGVAGSGGESGGAADILGGAGGAPSNNVNGLWGAGTNVTTNGQYGIYSGAGGSADNVNTIGRAGGGSLYGGAGGGGIDDGGTANSGAGGTSTHGGNGGAAGGDASNGTAGSQPGGGGGGGGPGGNSGAGGDGRIIVTEFF